jgi:hypothetical protein
MTLTAKQEKFAQVWHATGNKTEAYRQAYDCREMAESTINRKAVEVAENGNVAARYEELQKASQKRNNTTVDTLDAMFKEAWRIGKQNGNPSAMVSATSGLAKLHGLNAPDKQDVKHSGEITSITRRIVHHES